MFRLGTTRQGKNNMHWVVRWSCQDPPKKGKQNIHRALKCSCQEQNKGTKKIITERYWSRGQMLMLGTTRKGRGNIFIKRTNVHAMTTQKDRNITYIHREAKCSWQERPKMEGEIFIEGTNVPPKNDPKGKENIIREAKCSSQEPPEREGNIFIRRPNLHAENDRKGKEKYSSRGQMFMQRTNQKFIHSIIQ